MIKNELKKKLGMYTLASGAVLALGNNAEAQVTLVDISPDATLNDAGQSYMLDLNDDNTDDYEIKTVDFGGGAMALYINPLNSNGIIGFDDAGGFGYKAGALSLNAKITSTATDAGDTGFIWGGSAMMAVKGAGSNYGAFKNVTNKYVGLRLKSGSDFYYGWVRVDVNIANKSITIKDGAYNATANTSLKAGQTTGTGTTTAVEQSEELASQTVVFVNESNEISVNNNSGKAVSAVLMNTSGNQILTKEIGSGLTVLSSSNLVAGIYILNIKAGEAMVSKKVVIR